MRFLNAEQVRQAFPMDRAVPLMRETMSAHGRGQVFQPPRLVIEPPGLAGSVMLKPGLVEGPNGGFGLKALTIFPENRTRGLETIQAFVALLDPETGVPQAIVEGGTVTEIRTAAVSGVATDVLARTDAGDLAILGAGAQARGHLLAMDAVRKLRRVRVWNRAPQRAEEFVAWAAAAGFDVEVCAEVRDAVRGADLVCTVTAATEPVLLSAWVDDGAHVNAVGAYRADMRELDARLVKRAAVFAVDSRQGALADAGDLVLAIRDGAVPDDFDPPELGEVLVGSRPGRPDDGAVTVFESLGLAIQDVAAAAAIEGYAAENGIGTEISFP
jgi:ornithine cyclodeaminase/alanine dehydrogenase-like protein (mu-crystallin family)